MAVQATAEPPRSGRRVVGRARPTIDKAYGTVLAEVPVELHQAVRAYADARRAEFQARDALSSLMITSGVRWLDVERLTRELAFS